MPAGSSTGTCISWARRGGAQQHAAGARRSASIGGKATVEGFGEALRRSQGVLDQAASARRGWGRPVTAVLTVGERHEPSALDALMDRGTVRAQVEAVRACDRSGRQVKGGYFSRYAASPQAAPD
jgi:hypothetical protein